MKRLLPVILLAFFAIQVHAQYKPVIFGLRVGTNIGWINPDADEYVSEGIRMGFTWGFIGEFYLMENYAILTGFNMNFNGGKLEYPAMMSVPSGDTSMMAAGQLLRTYHLKYLQIPLCLKMKSEISDKFTIFGKIGLGTAFSLGAKADDEFSYTGGTESDSKKNINDDIALMRESLIVGGGVEFKLKESTALIVELTYDNMFNDMLTGDNPATPGDEPKGMHNFVEIGVGIVF
jgi:hypothetical protein